MQLDIYCAGKDCVVALKTTMQAVNEVVGDTDGATQATQVSKRSFEVQPLEASSSAWFIAGWIHASENTVTVRTHWDSRTPFLPSQDHGTILPMLLAAKTAQPSALTPLSIINEGLEHLEKLTAANLKAGVFQGVCSLQK